MERMWMRRGLLALSMLLAVVCLCALLLPKPVDKPVLQGEMQVKLPQEASAEVPPMQQAQADHPYEMGIWQGNVAVFVPGEPTPVRVLEMPAASLPLADQQALEARIPIKDDLELAGFLEDYGS